MLLAGPLAAQSAAGNAPPERREVVRLTFQGVKAVDVDELRASIATDASHCNSAILIPICWITKADYVYTRKFLNRDELARDILRARVFYWKRGYREAAVDTIVTNQGDKDARVTFVVTEGPPTMVRDITITQTQPVLTEKQIAGRMVLGENSPLNLIRLDSSLVFLQQALWDRGHADAIIDTTIVIDSATKNATIAIDLNPRWKATVSDVLVEGNEEVETKTILNSLTMHPGDLFRRSELLHSQRALYESNLFRRAAIEIPQQGDSSKILIVNVQESPLREARASAGFNTIDFFQLEGRFTHYNLLGGARRLDVQGALGNLLANSLNGRFIFRNVMQNVIADRDRYFAPTYNASVSLRQPWFQSHENELGLSVFSHRRSAPGVYIDRGYGTSATFTRELQERTNASLNYRFEISQVDAGDVYFCINHGLCDRATLDALRDHQRLSPLALSTIVDRANDPF